MKKKDYIMLTLILNTFVDLKDRGMVTKEELKEIMIREDWQKYEEYKLPEDEVIIKELKKLLKTYVGKLRK